MSRTYRDPIHKEINLNSDDAVENLLIKLIDAKEFQRLRWIKQLGTAWFTFHGAEASRFQHSIGAMQIARLMFEKISQDLELEPEQYRALIVSAALLHDIGHGPFSHSTEKITNIPHEFWTKKIILSKETEVHQILENYSKGFAERLTSVLSKNYPVKFLSNIVNSQLDCDRFDYLLRDSYYTGTSYGNFDLNRVISSITCNLDLDCLVVSGQKGMLAVEDYLYARYSMYMQVYQHKKCLATDIMLQKLFNRIKLLIHHRRISYIEKPVYDWLVQPETMKIHDYLLMDDTILIHHLKHWQEEKDVIVRDISRRFIERKLFKAQKIDNPDDIESILQNKSVELRRQNLDPDYYLEAVTVSSKPYSFYNPDASDFSKAIFVETGSKLEEISTISHVVGSLVKNSFANSWLIYAEPLAPSRYLQYAD